MNFSWTVTDTLRNHYGNIPEHWRRKPGTKWGSFPEWSSSWNGAFCRSVPSFSWFRLRWGSSRLTVISPKIFQPFKTFHRLTFNIRTKLSTKVEEKSVSSKQSCVKALYLNSFTVKTPHRCFPQNSNLISEEVNSRETNDHQQWKCYIDREQTSHNEKFPAIDTSHHSFTTSPFFQIRFKSITQRK